MKYLKALVFGLFLVVFGAGWAQAGTETTVTLKIVNDSGKSVPIVLGHTSMSAFAATTLASGQTWTVPVKNPAGTESTVHNTFLTFNPYKVTPEVLTNNPPPDDSTLYTLKVRNQFLGGEVLLEGISVVQNKVHGCAYQYEVGGFDGAKGSVVITIPNCN